MLHIRISGHLYKSAWNIKVVVNNINNNILFILYLFLVTFAISHNTVNNRGLKFVGTIYKITQALGFLTGQV